MPQNPVVLYGLRIGKKRGRNEQGQWGPMENGPLVLEATWRLAIDTCVGRGLSSARARPPHGANVLGPALHG